MARYVFLMFDDESWHDTIDEQGIAEEFRLHAEFIEAVRAAGAEVVGGEALERSSTATTVRGRESPTVTDGPFLDTKEALGGFHVIEAPDLDVALRLAAICPAGTVEVRPIMEMPEDA